MDFFETISLKQVFMLTEDNILHLPAFLGAQQLQLLDQLLEQAPFVDGRTTASDAAKLVKNNLQVDMNDRTVMPQLQQLVGMPLVSNPLLQDAVMPYRVYPILFSKYGAGMRYGWHVDSPAMGNPPVRTDMAMTLFLSDPSSYEGGELVIRTASGERFFKPAKGDAVVYPCNYVHQVSEVKSGERRAAVTWMQSAVRSAEKRRVLYDLKNAHALLTKKDPQSEETQLVLQTWSNLMRMWTEI